MELHIALKELVEKWGEYVITDESRLKRLLANKKAYKERPDTKEIVKFAIGIGYFDRIYEVCHENGWENEIQNIEAEFNNISSPMGFDVEDVNYVFSCIPFALGLIELDEEFEDDEDIEEESYTITKQYHENKDIDIFVVRLTDRVDTETFSDYKNAAKSHGKGYYSTFRGVNGFVFYTITDAKAFVAEIFGESTDADIMYKTLLFTPMQRGRVIISRHQISNK